MRVLLALSSFALVGCAETGGGGTAPAVTAGPEYQAINTLQEFNEVVVDRPLVYEGSNPLNFRSGGTLDGNIYGPVAGTWRWEDKYLCVDLSSPARPEDCQLWETNGVDVRATRAQGTGPSFVYTF